MKAFYDQNELEKTKKNNCSIYESIWKIIFTPQRENKNLTKSTYFSEIINTFFSQIQMHHFQQQKIIIIFPQYILVVRDMLKQEQSKDREKPVKIDKPQDKYPGICNLCILKQHLTIDCPFSIILFHATNLQNLISIVKNGFNQRQGRLGKAIYCSDDPSMCVRFVLKNRKKFNNPVLVKIKAMLTNIRTVNNSQEVRSITQEQFKKEKIECIKCPYFKVGDQILYQFALYDADYSIVGWSKIKFPEDRQQKQNIRNEKGVQISIFRSTCAEKEQNKMILEDCNGSASTCNSNSDQMAQNKIEKNQMMPEIEKQPVLVQKQPSRSSIAQKSQQYSSKNSSKQDKTKLISKINKKKSNNLARTEIKKKGLPEQICQKTIFRFAQDQLKN